MSALFISAAAFSCAKYVRANLGSRDQFPHKHLHAMDSEFLRIKAVKQERVLHESFQHESAMKFVTLTTTRGKKWRFRWKASAIEKISGHLKDEYFSDVSRTAVAQE